jgi:gamma-butyrobetaine dioxygenase
MNAPVKFFWDAESLALEADEGALLRFPAVWLRDQCHEGQGWSNAQRRSDLSDLPEHPRIQSVARQGERLEIRWSGEADVADVPIAWLKSVANPKPRTAPRLWTADESTALVWAEYESVLADRVARADWLEALLRDGVAFLRDVPPVDGESLRAASLLGYPIETNYGRMFHVRSEPFPFNLANTALALGLHTDNPYREPVPGYQVLHCLIAGAEGGDSLFADGYAVAENLRQTNPEAFAVLATIPVDFRYLDSATELTARRTLIELDRDGRTSRIHWNNRSMSTAEIALDHAEAFYAAYRAFAALLRSAQFVRRIRLQPGDLVAFDNGRLLHGRTAFAGERLLQGCYVGRDGVGSILAVLRRELAAASTAEEVIRLMSERGGGSYFGEPVSQLEHALQAAYFAAEAKSEPAMIAAALLHDIGHLLHDRPENIADQGVDTRHEGIGYDWLLARFGRALAEPVRAHVDAKRYLCRVDPEYYGQLSRASIQSLELQGGPFSEEQARRFEQLPGWREAVQLRRWDDAAKQPDLAVPALSQYRELLIELLSAAGRQ